MEFLEYEQLIKKTAIYPRIGKNLGYPTLGLAGEAGEVANKVKKIDRDQQGIWDRSNRADLCSELGDVLWYITAIALELELTLEEIASVNMDKLLGRKERGTLGGSGDKR